MPIKVFWSESCQTYAQVSVEPPLALHLAAAEVFSSKGHTCRIMYDHITQTNTFYGYEDLGKEALEAHRAFIQRAFLPYAKFAELRDRDRVEAAQQQHRDSQRAVEILLRECLTPDE